MPRGEIKDEKTYRSSALRVRARRSRPGSPTQRLAAHVARSAARAARAVPTTTGASRTWSSGQGNRHQGPLEDDQSGAGQGTARPLNRAAGLTTAAVKIARISQLQPAAGPLRPSGWLQVHGFPGGL